MRGHRCKYPFALLMPFVSHAFASVLAALLSPAGKGLTSWLLLVMFYCIFVTFPLGIMGQMRYLTVSFPDLCYRSYFASSH